MSLGRRHSSRPIRLVRGLCLNDERPGYMHEIKRGPQSGLIAMDIASFWCFRAACDLPARKTLHPARVLEALPLLEYWHSPEDADL